VETVTVKSVTETPVKQEGGCCGGKSETVTEKTAKTDSPSNIPDPLETIAGNYETLKVGGTCGMCKKRIETIAQSLEGVIAATWDKETQILRVAFNSPPTSLAAISKAVAGAGHDTEKDKADDKTYNALHECCKYRK
jgi:copper chaperone CopZ